MALFTTQLLLARDDWHLDARVAAFTPSHKLMREIYGDWQAVYEVEMGRFLCPNYEIWGNLSALSTNGKTRTLHTKTQLENANVSLGAKYLFYLQPCTQLCLGAGINGAFVHVHNDSSYVKRHVYKYGVGGVLKTGIYYQPTETLFLELFADYLYQRIHFVHHVQIGGIKIGGGVGLSF